MQNQSIEFFDTQFQRQAREGDFVLNPFELEALEHLQGSVLDLGAGLGNLSLEAGRRGHGVLAIDASPTAVARINRDAGREGLAVKAIEADLETWSIEQQYQSVVAIGLLSYFKRERAYAMLAAYQGCVLPGGRMAINVLIEGTTYMAMFRNENYYLFPCAELVQAFDGWKLLISDQSSFDAPGGTCKKLLTIIAEKPA